MRASVTSAIESSPRAARGATFANQRARPPSRTRRPRPSVTTTCRPAAPKRSRFTRREGGLLSGSTAVGVVRLHDLLHQRVADDILFVEVDEGDSFDLAHDFHRLHQPGRAANGKVDLRDV